MTTQTFQYDVAFSFLKRDEPLAVQINDLLADRLSTFLYSNRQKEIVGKDGEKTFNDVFFEKSRIVVVLYRNGWGSTPWTRIEETAIRNRAYDSGYDFVIFIPLDTPPQVPPWLPKTHMWANLERRGIQGAASVIEACVQRAGGNPREESVLDQAARIKRQIDLEEEKKAFLNSTDGVAAANSEVQNLLTIIERLLKEISERHHWQLRSYRRNENTFDFAKDRTWIGLDWSYSYANTLEQSKLIIALWEGPPPRPGVFTLGESCMISEIQFSFSISFDKSLCWICVNPKLEFSTMKLAEYSIKLLIDNIQKVVTEPPNDDRPLACDLSSND